jgi:GNAT superfamily N-acetyltransferase
VTSVAEVTVEPLTTDRFGDLSKLFMQGGDPKWCWCQYFRKPGLDWSNSTAQANRAALRRLAEKAVAPGLVAYRNDEAVGWVGLAPRQDYARLEASRILAPLDDKPVWSIVCFVVGRQSRGQGIATALLDAAIDYAREHGATILEAYPVSETRGRVSAANAYQGTQSMFANAGFHVAETRQWNKSTPIRPIMRREL